MTIIRYVDIYKTDETPEGLIETVSVKDATLPLSINSDRINSIQPYFTSKGKPFKNVSYINYDGELLKVVGNYKVLNDIKINDSKDGRVIIKGYRYNG